MDPHRRLGGGQRGLAKAASHLGYLKGTAYSSCLRDPNHYATLELRLESTHAAVEAAEVEPMRRARVSVEDAAVGVRAGPKSKGDYRRDSVPAAILPGNDGSSIGWRTELSVTHAENRTPIHRRSKRA